MTMTSEQTSGQARAVAAEAKGQARHLAVQAREQLEQQATTRAHEAASALRTWGDQLGSLAQGRPQEAGPLTGYLEQARTRVLSFAEQLDQRGPRGLLNDASRFARRKPGTFLVAAVAAGFAAGRLARAGGAVASEHRQDDSTRTTLPPYGSQSYGSQTAGSQTYGGQLPGQLDDPYLEPPIPGASMPGPTGALSGEEW